METHLDDFQKSDLAPISIDWDYRSTNKMFRLTEMPVIVDLKYMQILVKEFSFSPLFKLVDCGKLFPGGIKVKNVIQFLNVVWAD